jgi:hypothetical protein
LVNIHELIFPTLNSEEGRYRTPRGLNESRGHSLFGPWNYI